MSPERIGVEAAHLLFDTTKHASHLCNHSKVEKKVAMKTTFNNIITFYTLAEKIGSLGNLNMISENTTGAQFELLKPFYSE